MFDQDAIISPQLISSTTEQGVLNWTNTSTGVTQGYLDHGDGGVKTEYNLNLIAQSAQYIGGNPNLIFKIQQAPNNGGVPGTWIDSAQNVDGALNTGGVRAIAWFQIHRFSRIVYTFRGALGADVQLVVQRRWRVHHRPGRLDADLHELSIAPT
jgi:hypothetical protein